MKTCPACCISTIARQQLVFAAIGFPTACRSCGQAVRVAHGWQHALTLGWIVAGAFGLVAIVSYRQGWSEGFARSVLLTALPLLAPPISIATWARPHIKPSKRWAEALLPWALLIGIGLIAAIIVRISMRGAAG